MAADMQQHNHRFEKMVPKNFLVVFNSLFSERGYLWMMIWGIGLYISQTHQGAYVNVSFVFIIYLIW